MATTGDEKARRFFFWHTHVVTLPLDNEVRNHGAIVATLLAGTERQARLKAMLYPNDRSLYATETTTTMSLWRYECILPTSTKELTSKSSGESYDGLH